jgi:hypothetical protein
MSDASIIARHACSAIGSCGLEAHPFAHLVVEELLPPGVHAALVEALPSIEHYERPEYALAAGERAILAPTAPSLPVALRSILEPVDAALRSAAFVNGLLAKLGVAATAEEPRGAPPGVQVFLARDVLPYAIGPHTDVPARLASGVLYLSPAHAPPEWGTTLFAPSDARFVCAQGRHYAFEGFLPARTVPFAANRAVVFRRSDRSFHGLRPLPADPRTRDVLLFEIVRAGIVRKRGAP